MISVGGVEQIFQLPDLLLEICDFALPFEDRDVLSLIAGQKAVLADAQGAALPLGVNQPSPRARPSTGDMSPCKAVLIVQTTRIGLTVPKLGVVSR